MAVTIKDIAAMAGVSPSTVSRVCNDNPSISKETKERVRKVMAELGYEPNVTASTQNDQGIKMVGIILPPSLREVYGNSFYLEAIRGISQFCNKRQAASTIITGNDDTEIIQAIQTLATGSQVDGFILLYSKQEDPIVDFLCEQGYLYVVIGKANQLASQTICIDNDNLLAGQEATDYLYDLGHRKIGYVGCENIFLFSADRKSGYQLSLLQHNLPIRPEYCIEVEHRLSDKDGCIHELLSREDRPTAIVVSDDILAVALEQICAQTGLSIPKDISIVAFNNSLFAQLSPLQLTSVEINSFQLGYEAASQLINHSENPNLMATKIIVPHRIIKRDSCKEIAEEE